MHQRDHIGLGSGRSACSPEIRCRHRHPAALTKDSRRHLQRTKAFNEMRTVTCRGEFAGCTRYWRAMLAECQRIDEEDWTGDQPKGPAERRISRMPLSWSSVASMIICAGISKTLARDGCHAHPRHSLLPDIPHSHCVSWINGAVPRHAVRVHPTQALEGAKRRTSHSSYFAYLKWQLWNDSGTR